MPEAALDGLLVVTLEQAVAAPYCSRLLSGGGARVIKLERPEGDFARAYDTVVNGQSGYFVWLNSGKESVVVDLKRAVTLDSRGQDSLPRLHVPEDRRPRAIAEEHARGTIFEIHVATCESSGKTSSAAPRQLGRLLDSH